MARTNGHRKLSDSQFKFLETLSDCMGKSAGSLLLTATSLAEKAKLNREAARRSQTPEGQELNAFLQTPEGKAMLAEQKRQDAQRLMREVLRSIRSLPLAARLV
jgi:hypothetical protein